MIVEEDLWETFPYPLAIEGMDPFSPFSVAMTGCDAWYCCSSLNIRPRKKGNTWRSTEYKKCNRSESGFLLLEKELYTSCIHLVGVRIME